MAQTFKDLQDRINLDYLNRTDFVQETKRAIIRAIKHYERARLWFNQTTTGIIAVATNVVALPADFIALDMVTHNWPLDLTKRIINQRDYERVTFRNMSGLSASVVEECAVYNNSLYLYPKTLAASTSLQVAYTYRLAALSADTDNNSWCDEAEDLICYHAAADVLANVIRGRPDDVSSMQNMEAVALASLQRARNLHMNTNEDLSVMGPVHRQESSKTDGSPPPNDQGKGV